MLMLPVWDLNSKNVAWLPAMLHVGKAAHRQCFFWRLGFYPRGHCLNVTPPSVAKPEWEADILSRPLLLGYPPLIQGAHWKPIENPLKTPFFPDRNLHLQWDCPIDPLIQQILPFKSQGNSQWRTIRCLRLPPKGPSLVGRQLKPLRSRVQLGAGLGLLNGNDGFHAMINKALFMAIHGYQWSPWQQAE